MFLYQWHRSLQEVGTRLFDFHIWSKWLWSAHPARDFPDFFGVDRVDIGAVGCGQTQSAPICWQNQAWLRDVKGFGWFRGLL